MRIWILSIKDKYMKKLIIFICSCCWILNGFTQEKEVKAVIETNLGNMTVKLYNDTPTHRDNFIRLAKAGHYDGTLFYRVIKNFVIRRFFRQPGKPSKVKPSAMENPLS